MMSRWVSRTSAAAAAAMLLLAGALPRQADAGAAREQSVRARAGAVPLGQPRTGAEVDVKQEPGKTVYWILPGPRRLGAEEWGTPERPRALLPPVLAKARALPPPLNRSVPELLRKLPILGGLPLGARETSPDGSLFTTTKGPTAVSDSGRIVSGQFHVTYVDRQPYDLGGPLTQTKDRVEASAEFTDPQGNRYRLIVDRLWQPPIPGWETGGGVLTGAWIHGGSATESPLFPRAFAYGAFWALGRVVVNGEVVNQEQWIHFMTTQTVRDKDYRLATQDELPLDPRDTIAGQIHHAHIVVRPVANTPGGPVFEPVHTAFTLSNGQKQPFLHIMFEQNTIVRGPFRDWAPTGSERAGSAGPDRGERDGRGRERHGVRLQSRQHHPAGRQAGHRQVRESGHPGAQPGDRRPRGGDGHDPAGKRRHQHLRAFSNGDVSLLVQRAGPPGGRNGGRAARDTLAPGGRAASEGKTGETRRTGGAAPCCHPKSRTHLEPTGP